MKEQYIVVISTMHIKNENKAFCFALTLVYQEVKIGCLMIFFKYF